MGVLGGDGRAGGAGSCSSGEQDALVVSSSSSSSRARILAVMAGGIMIHLTLGTFYLFGSIMPYVFSYLTMIGEEPSHEGVMMIFNFAFVGEVVGYAFSIVLQRSQPPWRVSFIGCFVFSSGVFLSSFGKSISYLCVTYGLMLGCGIGLAYTPPIKAGLMVIPQRAALVTGFIVSAFGGGSMFFSFLSLLWVNPHNESLSPVLPEDVALRVPSLFRFLGTLYAFLSLTGSLLLRPPSGMVKDGEYMPLSLNGGQHLENSEKASPVPGTAASSAPGKGDGRRKGAPLVIEVEMELDETGEMAQPQHQHLGPEEIWKQVAFWHLVLSFVLTTLGGMVLVGSYKAIAAPFIGDDRFLTGVGAVSSFFNCAGRVMWGILADRAKSSMLLLLIATIIQAVLLLVLKFSLFNNSAFACVIWGIMTCYGSSFALYPAITSRLFGSSHVGANYSLVMVGFSALSAIALTVAPKSASATLALPPLIGVASLLILRYLHPAAAAG
jgi:hypothetical protein